MAISDLPALNASLNGLSALFLGAGYVFILRGRKDAHRVCMAAALASSALFLASYCVYHWSAGSVRFTGTGWIRPAYFALLISHVVLAAGIVPLVLGTVRFAWLERFSDHKRWGRVTLPLWAYVSVTGIAVYVMLYRMTW